MTNQHAYNKWAASYDHMHNKTRDLEAQALKLILDKIAVSNVLEIGCGTGKNTAWLAERAKTVTSVDFSSEMLEKARLKIKNENVSFVQADITCRWDFIDTPIDLITCSLVLEHLKDLRCFFNNACSKLASGGFLYICELHPFKQYTGSKARFQCKEELIILECHTHHVSDYMTPALQHQLTCEHLGEWFDDENHSGTPRLISFLFRK